MKNQSKNEAEYRSPFWIDFGSILASKIDQNRNQNLSKNEFGCEVASKSPSGLIFGPIWVDFWINFGPFWDPDSIKLRPWMRSRSQDAFWIDFWTNFERFV